MFFEDGILGLIYPIVAVGVVLFALWNSKKNKNKTVKKRPQKTVASDGHVLQGKNDPTCARYGHVHPEAQNRYIVHDEPKEGYVNLNGKLMTLKEAAKY